MYGRFKQIDALVQVNRSHDLYITQNKEEISQKNNRYSKDSYPGKGGADLRQFAIS
jgi:hypothetical protein